MEAFLYCWTDLLTNKLYIGVHKGKFDDGYICSSKIVLEEHKKRPNDFYREIVATGSYKEMLIFETKILTSLDAAHDSFFYNLHNGDGKFYNKQHSDATKLKMSRAAKGKPKSADHVKKIIASHIGVKLGPCSEERKIKIGLANTGKKRSLEYCEQMSQFKKGCKYPNRKRPTSRIGICI